MARPRKPIDKTEFEKLCGLMCTKEEIAGWFSVSEDTIERFCKREYEESFAVVHKKHSSVGRISLRRSQFKLAEKSPAMAIFLGKNYLGQRDYFEQENNTAIEKLDRILEGIENAVEVEPKAK